MNDCVSIAVAAFLKASLEAHRKSMAREAPELPTNRVREVCSEAIHAMARIDIAKRESGNDPGCKIVWAFQAIHQIGWIYQDQLQAAGFDPRYAPSRVKHWEASGVPPILYNGLPKLASIQKVDGPGRFIKLLSKGVPVVAPRNGHAECFTAPIGDIQGIDFSDVWTGSLYETSIS